jgi:transposase
MYAHMSSHVRTVGINMDPYSAFIPVHCGAELRRLHGISYCVRKYIDIYEYVVLFVSLMTTAAKRKVLLASGTLNPHPEAVRAELFQMDFFDPLDRAQVKYEMLRAHSVDGDPVAEACRQFGFSRESFYQIQQAFSDMGFISLLPGKRGRKGPVKLKGEVLEFALEKKKENPDMDPAQLAALIKQRYGTEIHRTTVMRGMKKKRRSPSEGQARRVRSKRRSGTGDL